MTEDEQEDNQDNLGLGNASDINVSDIVINNDEDEPNNDIEVDDVSTNEDSLDESNEDESSGDDTDTSADEANDDGESGGTGDQEDSNTNEDEQDESNDDYNEEESYLALSEETGVEVTSDDDVINKLKELASLREGSDLSKLSPAIQAAIKVEQEGGNLSEHFARVSMDFDKMDTKEVLRQQFFKNDAKLYGTNPKLAKMKFERHFNEKYGKWESYNNLTDDSDKEDFLDENGGQDSIDYEKMMLDNDAALAKEELQVWKDEVKPVEKQATDGGLTEEEATTYANDYSAKVEETLSSFNSVAISMGEGSNDFELGLNEATKPTVEGWMKNPSTFLQDIGFNGQEIDTQRLMPIMTLLAEASLGDLGAKIAKFTVDSENVETIRQAQEKPNGKTGADSSQGRGALDDWEAIGEEAQKASETATRR